MSPNNLDGGGEAAIPGSVTDFTKALRELIALLRDFAKFVDDGNKVVAGRWHARKSRIAAGNLDKLAFSPSGSRQFLERIAAGTGTPEDVAAIEKKLEATANDVEESMRKLIDYREMLREICGMAAAEKLDQIIYDKFSDGGLRYALKHIVEIGHNQDPLPLEAMQIASNTLQKIASLNEQVGELHDLVLANSKV